LVIAGIVVVAVRSRKQQSKTKKKSK